MGTALLKADSGIDTLLLQRLDRIGRPAAGLVRPAPNCGILIADGDDLVRVLLGTGLRQEGRTVWLARSGDEALELYRRHANEIGLVLLAVRLPGLDGPQTLAALRRIDPGVRCCFLSGPLSEFTDAELLK
jgi:CheY-like chemotaxis protein